MYHYCFRIYKKYHHVETVIGWDEISPKEEAEYLATQDKIQLNDGLLTELQIDVLTKREREIIIMRYGLFGVEPLTQKEVADKMGISQSYISRLEKRIIEKMRQDIEQLVKIA